MSSDIKIDIIGQTITIDAYGAKMLRLTQGGKFEVAAGDSPDEVKLYSLTKRGTRTKWNSFYRLHRSDVEHRLRTSGAEISPSQP